MKKNLEEIVKNIREDSSYARYIKKELLDDKEFSLLILEANPNCYYESYFKFREDKDVIRFMLDKDTFSNKGTLIFSKEKLINDPEYDQLYTEYKKMMQKRGYAMLFKSICDIKNDSEYDLRKITDQFVSNIDKLLSENLDDRQLKVIRERFGLDDGKPKQLETIGNNFNISKLRVNQIEEKSLTILRTNLNTSVIEEAIKSNIPGSIEFIQERISKLDKIEEGNLTVVSDNQNEFIGNKNK